MSEGMREVLLPADLCQAAERKFQERFGGLDQLLTFALQELVRGDAEKMDSDEERMLTDRLRDLGYL